MCLVGYNANPNDNNYNYYLMYFPVEIMYADKHIYFS